MADIQSEELAKRMNAAVTLAWQVFARKVGGGLTPINKEASMQLQYAYVLQQLVPIITFHEGESFGIELETGVPTDGSTREIDLLFSGHNEEAVHRIAVEMKCYRTLTSSGKNRGATDIFMKDVYFDLHLLERYVELGHAHEGVSLVMNDREGFVNPKQKNAKCWDYDISNGAKPGNQLYNTPIGGEAMNFRLDKNYEISWSKFGEFWFSEIQALAPDGQ